MHEFMHLLGFAHEQKNSNANLSIKEDRIQGEYLRQYRNFDDLALTPHDKFSIMHYDSWKWSICSNPKNAKWNVLLRKEESERPDMPHISCRDENWWDLTADKNNGDNCREECAVFHLEDGSTLHSNRLRLSPSDVEGIKIMYGKRTN